jgi:hypothetical protein
MGLGCSEMEKIFIMESKIFIFSILDGASRLRVGEKRIFSGEIVISSQCSEWFALTMEILLGYPKDQEFIKSFREGSKIVITRRGSNQAGRFLEVAVFGLGGRKWFILIPEGSGGWGWIKFSDDMRKAATFFFSAKMDSKFGSPAVLVKNEGKKEESKLGLAYWKGPSFVEVLSSGTGPIAGGSRSRLFPASVEPCDLDLLLSISQAEEELRTVVDCFSLEAPPHELMSIDRPLCPPGKKILAHPNLRFKLSKCRTWSKLDMGSNLALGWVVRKLLAHFFGIGLGHRSGFRFARLFPKPVPSHPLSILPEMSPEITYGSPSDRLFTGVLVNA